jgi:uncharacterized damage-inducible protein DinB
MKYSIKQHLAYNLWANQRIAGTLNPVDDEIIFAELKSSFPGIARTILHIWDAELIWLTRMQGKIPEHLPSKEFKGNKIDLINGIIESSKEIVAYIDLKGAGFFSEKISYKTSKGDTYENNIEDILMHLVNHGTYHRGQLITMLREQGITYIKSTDIITYLRIIEK